MTEPVDFNERKKAKAPKCEFCGAEAHKETLMCDRICAVLYHSDGCVEIVFHDDWKPVAG
jgi:hypothetical protein